MSDRRAEAERAASFGALLPELAVIYPDLAERARINRKLIEKWLTNGFDYPVDDPAAFYSDEYWRRDRFRPYPRVHPGGLVEVAEYYPPAPEWMGFTPLLEGLWGALGEKPATLLDVGCGCGSLVGQARRQGVDARGVDVSAYAIQHPVPDARGHIQLRDICAPGGGVEPAEVVSATDLMEHIHEPYVDGVIRSLLHLTDKHLVMCICVARTPDSEWVHQLGTPVPLERAWIAVAGHVTLHPQAWWVERFEKWTSTGMWHVNWEAMCRFSSFMCLHPTLKTIDSWSPANILILSRNEQ